MPEREWTHEELIDFAKPFQQFVGRKIQHVKTSSWYKITGIHYRETDMRLLFSYETLNREPISFVRPIEELLDNRFKLG